MIKFIDHVLGLVSLIGAAMLTVPLSILLLGTAFPLSYVFVPLLAVVFSFVGFFLQSVNAKLQNKRKSLDGFSSVKEGIVAGFKPIYAAVPILIILVLGVPVTLAFDSLSRAMFYYGVTFRYDVIYTVFFALIYLLSSVIGVVMWFYPAQRLSHIYVLLSGAALFYVESFFLAIYADFYPRFLIAVPIVIFTLCVLLVFNQSNLQKQYRGSVVSVMTPSSRLYNVFLVFVLFLAFLAVAYVVYILLSGMWIILKSVLYVLLFRLFHTNTVGELEEYDYVDSDEAMAQFKRDVVSNENVNIIAVFIFIVAIGLVLYFGIKKGFLVKLFVRIRDWIREVISVYLIGREIFKNSFDPNEVDELNNYQDEKKRIQNAAIRDYDAMADATEDYKTFIRELGRLRDYDSQLCYAYSVLLKIYKKMNIALKQSDTPRQVEKKVERAVEKADIERITADFEKVRYAEAHVSDSEAAEILGNICAEVKRYMY